jgi:hypothetical protein
MLTFTTVMSGLCAFVVENYDHAKLVNANSGGPILAVASYPAIAIGVIVRDNCRVNLTLVEGIKTPRLIVGRQAYSFQVKIDETAATLWLDDLSFAIPRTNTN